MPKQTFWEFLSVHANEFKTLAYSMFIFLNIILWSMYQIVNLINPHGSGACRQRHI